MMATMQTDDSSTRPSTTSNTLLFRNDGLEYHTLTKLYRDEVLMVLSRAFCTEPIIAARGEIDPTHRASLPDWVEFVDFWMDHCSTNGLSVVCLDPTNHRVAGAFIVRELLHIPDEFDDTYSSEDKVLTPWMKLLWHMDRKATEALPGLADAGAAVDLWVLGVHPDYRGRRIASHLTGAVVPLIRSAGYKYGTIEATSHFTSCAAKSNDFRVVYEYDAKDWEWMGEKPYTNAKAPHGTWKFWVKNLQEETAEPRLDEKE